MNHASSSKLGAFERILLILVANHKWRTISEISEKAGVPESAAKKIVTFLAGFGMLGRSLSTDRYKISTDLNSFFNEIEEMELENI
jgi:DNA-binding IclR family transcriptional regulator